MPASSESLSQRLAHLNEIKITVTGRSSGRAITIPVWFVTEENSLFLLPLKGSDTQWYKNVLKKPSLLVEAGSTKTQLHVELITNSAQVSSLVEKFRNKYGAAEVKKYYSKFDVALVGRAA
jgi:hypothetical protein